MTVEACVRKFLRLEILAVELYRAHLRHVPLHLKPLLHHLAKVEERHRDYFHQAYHALTGHRPPRSSRTIVWARLIAWFVGQGGPRAILHFECWVEERAIRDYQNALVWIKHPEIRHTIQTIQRDELSHAPLLETLRLFQKDERQHIREMENALKHL